MDAATPVQGATLASVNTTSDARDRTSKPRRTRPARVSCEERVRCCARRARPVESGPVPRRSVLLSCRRPPPVPGHQADRTGRYTRSSAAGGSSVSGAPTPAELAGAGRIARREPGAILSCCEWVMESRAVKQRERAGDASALGTLRCARSHRPLTRCSPPLVDRQPVLPNDAGHDIASSPQTINAGRGNRLQHLCGRGSR